MATAANATDERVVAAIDSLADLVEQAAQVEQQTETTRQVSKALCYNGNAATSVIANSTPVATAPTATSLVPGWIRGLAGVNGGLSERQIGTSVGQLRHEIFLLVLRCVGDGGFIKYQLDIRNRQTALRFFDERNPDLGRGKETTPGILPFIRSLRML